MSLRSLTVLVFGILAVVLTMTSTFAQSKALTFDTFRVECFRKIEVAAQADGLISEMLVDEGSTVPAGGILFRIDNRVAQAQLEVASKEYESAVKQAQQDADVRFAQATHSVAKAEAEAERELLKKNATTVAVFRRKELEEKKAELQIEVAKVKRETDSLAANVAEAKKKAAQVQLGLYDIVAPWDAVVVERMKDQGAWIRAGEPVMKIQHMQQMRVVGFINIKDLKARGLSLNNLEGAKVQVTVAISPTQSYSIDSFLEFISSNIDDSNNARVWARVKNERVGDSWLLRDGMPAEVTIAIQ